jgi:muramoyltetrapeptide carboxypeptidase
MQIGSLMNRVGIYAASSIVPSAEFELGLALLQNYGFDVAVHPQVHKQHFIYPGTDRERAEALYDLACDDVTDILWAARGGYGAGRILPILDQITRERGKPKRQKLLVGYSDVTVLHEFVRHHWGFATLHASMPAGMSFAQLKPEERDATLACARGKPTAFAWENTKLSFMTDPPGAPIDAEIVGGNLALWSSIVGTPYEGIAGGRILFLEDVDERPYRIDRMFTQIAQAGGLEGVRAIILGDFTNCDDEVSTCFKPLKSGADPRKLMEPQNQRERIPLRKSWPIDSALREIFGSVGSALNIPIATGLPVGHGPGYSPLPLGARYRLGSDGTLSLIRWDWNGTNKE